MPHPWSAGNILTAADLNAIVCDSVGEIGPDSFGPTSGTTPLVFDSDTVPDQGVAGRLHVWTSAYISKSVSTDRFTVNLYVDGATICTIAETNPGASDRSAFASTGSASIAAGSTHAITHEITRVSGTGTATLLSGAQTVMHWIFVPT